MLAITTWILQAVTEKSKKFTGLLLSAAYRQRR